MSDKEKNPCKQWFKSFRPSGFKMQDDIVRKYLMTRDGFTLGDMEEELKMSDTSIWRVFIQGRLLRVNELQKFSDLIEKFDIK